MPFRDQFDSKEAYNEYFRKYRAANKDKIRAYYREYNRKWRKAHGYPNEKAYAERNPEKRNAHFAVSYAKRTGKLVQQPCERCNNPCSQAHHDDYSRQLEVRWLCPVHHTEYHRKLLEQAA